jgi:hypothetical protein
VLLVVLGVSMVAASPGVGILLFAIPPIAAGVWAFGDGKWARPIGVVVSLAYAAVVGFVATTPLRGATPPPGAPSPPIDIVAVAITIGFLLAGVLLFASGGRKREVAQS